MARPVDLGAWLGACRPRKGTGGHSAARLGLSGAAGRGVHTSPWRWWEPLCARSGRVCLPLRAVQTALRAAGLGPAHPPGFGIGRVVPAPGV